ncbi:MAG: hypothetical protein B6D58_03565 [candidate division Zixibacteria bacterium 4484_95]|nr:MAG: hypothetical protein B6D58_03565 [candidate division Zixibacteria bacterium 4484_95]RKX17496.1 MAG: hypothetical protein DRP26_06880 [candidate division Zixibacteria bacterium]
MPKKLIIPYVSEQSNVFKKIKRPKLKLSIYSKYLKCWISIEDILADTGADISILPKSLGILMVGNYKNGKRYRITGLLPETATNMYLHKLSVRLADRKFKTTFAISNSNDIPPTLGRVGGLDNLDIQYKRGQKIVIHW